MSLLSDRSSWATVVEIAASVSGSPPPSNTSTANYVSFGRLVAVPGCGSASDTSAHRGACLKCTGVGGDGEEQPDFDRVDDAGFGDGQQQHR